MISLFLTDSPLQLINAIEAKRRFSIRDENAVLFLYKGVSVKNLEQQKALSRRFSWHSIVVIDYPVNIYHQNGIGKINRKISRLGMVRDVVIGDYRNDEMKHVANRLSPERVILLDDGNATIHIARERQERSGIMKTLRSLIKTVIFRFKVTPIEKVIFFTVYQVQTTASDSVVRNEYAVLRKEMQSKPDSRDIVFLGCPFAETPTVSESFGVKAYLQLLSCAKSFILGIYGDRTITYAAHRRETREKLRHLREIKNIEAIDFDEPIELVLLKRQTRPFLIATFFSAAVDSLRQIFGDEIRILTFEIPKHLIDPAKRRTINGYYDYYRQEYANASNFSLVCVKDYYAEGISL